MSATPLVWLIAQATAVLAAAWLLDRWLAPKRAVAAAALWNAVMLALVMLPLATLLAPRLELPVLPALDTEPSGAPPDVVQHVEPWTAPPTATAPDVRLASDERPLDVPARAPLPDQLASPRRTSTVVVAAPDSAVRWTLSGIGMTIYALGGLWGCVRLLVSWRAVQRLRRSATPVLEQAWQARLAPWSSTLDVVTPVELLSSEAANVPLALGVRRPAIVLPAALVDCRVRSTIDAILVHELAHVARRDCAWQWIQRLVEIIWWFHPLVWWARRRVTLARERACDDFSIFRLGDRQIYSEVLLDIARRVSWKRSIGLAMALVRSSQLESRLAAIEQSAGSAQCQWASVPRRTSLAGIALAVVAAASISLVHAQAAPPADDASTTPPPVSAAPTKKEQPNAPTQPAGDLSISVKLLEVEGGSVPDGYVIFYRAVGDDEPAEASDWLEVSTGRRWRPFASDPRNGLLATHLAPGEYRCIATTDFSRILGYAIGEPITLDGSQRETATTLQLKPGATVTIRAVDADSGEPVVGTRFTLRASDPKLPSMTYNSAPPEASSATFRYIPDGRYVYGGERGANDPSQKDYAYVESAGPVELSAEHPNELVVKLTAKERTQEEIDRRWPFVATGVVRDADGQPVEGATVKALQDVVWLPPTGKAATDAEGRYTLHFGPGYGRTEEHLPRAVAIAASKPGFFETHLNRQGALTMAMRQPAEARQGSPNVVLPGAPQEIDFALTPAASLTIEMVDEKGQPLRGRNGYLTLTGNQLPPHADSLQFGKLSEKGTFQVRDVPLGIPWIVLLQLDGGADVRTPRFVLREPGDYKMQVKFQKHPATGLDQMRIVHVVEPADAGTGRFRLMQRDVTAEVRTDDPLWNSPLPEAQQVEGRELLRKLGEANRYWLGRPPEDVKEYEYVFHLVDQDPRTIRVDNPQSDGLWFVHGITYSPLLAMIAHNPDKVVFQLVDVGPERIRLVYSLLERIKVEAGNGIQHSWRGYFSNGRMHHAELVLEAKTLRPISHETDDFLEKFDEYVDLRPGHPVPRHIAIQNGDMHFDWRFKVYEPGLWLFDRSLYSYLSDSEPVAHVDNVQVNGEPGQPMP